MRSSKDFWGVMNSFRHSMGNFMDILNGFRHSSRPHYKKRRAREKRARMRQHWKRYPGQKP